MHTPTALDLACAVPALDPPPVAAGPHLLEAGLAMRPGSGPQRQLAARRDALLQIGWRHSALRLGRPRAAQPASASWFGAARWWIDRNSVSQQIVDARPDIIETADAFALGGAVLDAADRLGAPAVALCPGDPLLGLRTPESLQRRGRRGSWAERQALGLLQRVYGAYDLVLVPSRAMAGLLKSIGVEHAACQPLGVDCAVFSPSACDHAWRHELQARLHVVPGTHMLVYVGHFSASMRLDLLVQAVEALGPGHVLLAVGEGPCPPRGDAVRCLPPPADDAGLARLLACCDAFVHAGGSAEPSGLAALEAMACGLPVVVAREGGLGEMAEGAGTTIDSDRVDEWAQAIRAAVCTTSWPHFWAALERARSHDWGAVVHREALRYRQALGSVRSTGEALAHEIDTRAQAALTP